MRIVFDLGRFRLFFFLSFFLSFFPRLADTKASKEGLMIQRQETNGKGERMDFPGEKEREKNEGKSERKEKERNKEKRKEKKRRFCEKKTYRYSIKKTKLFFDVFVDFFPYENYFPAIHFFHGSLMSYWHLECEKHIGFFHLSFIYAFFFLSFFDSFFLSSLSFSFLSFCSFPLFLVFSFFLKAREKIAIVSFESERGKSSKRFRFYSGFKKKKRRKEKKKRVTISTAIVFQEREKKKSFSPTWGKFSLKWPRGFPFFSLSLKLFKKGTENTLLLLKVFEFH